MKHIFFIHSPIVALVAEGIVRADNIRAADCVAVLAHGQVSNLPNGVAFPFDVLPKEYTAPSAFFWGVWQKMKVLDAWIHTITGGDSFIYYLPHANANFQHIIISNQLCDGYAYMEEGSLAYYYQTIKPSKKKSFLRDIFYPLCYKGRSRHIKPYIDFYIKKKYKACYAFSDEAFVGAPNRRLLPFPSNTALAANYPTCRDLLVLGPFIEYGQLSSATFLACIRALLDHCKQQGAEQIFVKYHPRQRETIEQLEKLFATQTLTVTRLAPDTILEYLALRGNIRFYVITSSTAIYASFVEGNEIISAARLAARLQPDFEQHLAGLPNFVVDKMLFI